MERRDGLHRLRDFGIVVLATATAAILLRTFVVQAYRVASHSMEPLLVPGDVLLVNKLLYGTTVAGIGIPGLMHPKRGDVLAFRFPPDRDARGAATILVKRCAGIPGDTIALVNGTFQLTGMASAATDSLPGDLPTWTIPRGGELISLNPSHLPVWYDIVAHEGHEVTVVPDGRVLVDGTPATTYRVEQNYYFMVGDNAAESSDSRNWGLVPEAALIGKGLLVYWSKELKSGSGERSRVRWERIGTLIR